MELIGVKLLPCIVMEVMAVLEVALVILGQQQWIIRQHWIIRQFAPILGILFARFLMTQCVECGSVRPKILVQIAQGAIRPTRSAG